MKPPSVEAPKRVAGDVEVEPPPNKEPPRASPANNKPEKLEFSASSSPLIEETLGTDHRRKEALPISTEELRNAAGLALDALENNRLSRSEVIAQFEKLAQLEPAVHSHLMTLITLYTDDHQKEKALAAAHRAVAIATNTKDRKAAEQAVRELATA